uniref:Proteasome (prosome, macropain) assembly chaperone 3 n=1 Tax=Eptatretus burgeri TaxID=7764 RepID=A0A8C4QWR5_EPTBU
MACRDDAMPVRTREVSGKVCGVSTQVVCAAFADRVFVTVSQCGRIGTLVSMSPALPTNSSDQAPCESRVLLGPDEPMTHVLAKNLAEPICREAGLQPVLLGLALRTISPQALSELRQLIDLCRIW